MRSCQRLKYDYEQDFSNTNICILYTNNECADNTDYQYSKK